MNTPARWLRSVHSQKSNKARETMLRTNPYEVVCRHHPHQQWFLHCSSQFRVIDLFLHSERRSCWGGQFRFPKHRRTTPRVWTTLRWGTACLETFKKITIIGLGFASAAMKHFRFPPESSTYNGSAHIFNCAPVSPYLFLATVPFYGI